MRKLVFLVVVLLVSVLAAMPLAAHSGVPNAPARTAALTVTGDVGTSLVCILPYCNGPYCRGANGCLVCCTN